MTTKGVKELGGEQKEKGLVDMDNSVVIMVGVERA